MSDLASIKSEDKTSVGVSSSGQDVLSNMISLGWFASELVAFESAVCFAIKCDLNPSTDGSFPTKWNKGSLSEIVSLVETYFQSETPVRLVERLGDAGLLALAERIPNAVSIVSLFDL